MHVGHARTYASYMTHTRKVCPERAVYIRSHVDLACTHARTHARGETANKSKRKSRKIYLFKKQQLLYISRVARGRKRARRVAINSIIFFFFLGKLWRKHMHQSVRVTGEADFPPKNESRSTEIQDIC